MPPSNKRPLFKGNERPNERKKMKTKVIETTLILYLHKYRNVCIMWFKNNLMPFLTSYIYILYIYAFQVMTYYLYISMLDINNSTVESRRPETVQTLLWISCYFSLYIIDVMEHERLLLVGIRPE